MKGIEWIDCYVEGVIKIECSERWNDEIKCGWSWNYVEWYGVD